MRRRLEGAQIQKEDYLHSKLSMKMEMEISMLIGKIWKYVNSLRNGEIYIGKGLRAQKEIQRFSVYIERDGTATLGGACFVIFRGEKCLVPELQKFWYEKSKLRFNREKDDSFLEMFFPWCSVKTSKLQMVQEKVWSAGTRIDYFK